MFPVLAIAVLLVFLNSVEKYQHILSLSAFPSTPTSLVANTTSVLSLP